LEWKPQEKIENGFCLTLYYGYQKVGTAKWNDSVEIKTETDRLCKTKVTAKLKTSTDMSQNNFRGFI